MYMYSDYNHRYYFHWNYSVSVVEAMVAIVNVHSFVLLIYGKNFSLE